MEKTMHVGIPIPTYRKHAFVAAGGLGIRGDDIQALVPSPCLVVGICSESNCKWQTHLWRRSQGGPPANPQMCAAESFWPREGGTKAVCLPKTGQLSRRLRRGCHRPRR